MATGNIMPSLVGYEAREDVTRQHAAAQLIYNMAGRRLEMSISFRCIQEKVHSAGPWEKKDQIQVSILSSRHRDTPGFTPNRIQQLQSFRSKGNYNDQHSTLIKVFLLSGKVRIA